MPRQDLAVPVGLAENLLGSAARTSSGNTGPLVGWGSARLLRAQLNVTAASGVTPTLNVVIEDTIDGVNWNTVGTFAQRGSTGGREVINIVEPFTDTLRVRWTVTGTLPSYTFAVDVYSE